MMYKNDRVKDIDNLKRAIVSTVITAVPSEVERVMIGQDKINDNSISISAFCGYIKGAENLKWSSDGSPEEIKLSDSFRKDVSFIENSIKNKIIALHDFDTVTVELFFSDSKDDKAVLRFHVMIEAYHKEDKETIY